MTSNTARHPDNPTVVFTSADAREIVSLLERRGHQKAAIIGGAGAITEFVAAELVDELILIVEPTIKLRYAILKNKA